ncbi:MAG: hypothetical protein WBQ60_11040 [Asticcacaulis sp.]
MWEIADDLTSRLGRQARRPDVLDLAIGEGIHSGTASAQYNEWRRAYVQRQAENGVSEAPVAPLHMRLQMGTDGRILIPLDMRRAMKIGADGQLNAALIEGELRLFSPRIALEKLQSYALAHDQGAGSAVDELLTERRIEAGRE